MTFDLFMTRRVTTRAMTLRTMQLGMHSLRTLRTHYQRDADQCVTEFHRSQYIAVNEDEEEKEKLSEDVKEQSKEESESSSVKSPHVQRGGKRRRDTAADKVIAASTASIDRLTAVAERLVEGMVKSNPSTQSAGSSQVSGVMLPPPMPADCTPREYYRALAAFYSALEANSGPDPAVPKV